MACLIEALEPMHASIEALDEVGAPYALILCAGFEDRAARAVELFGIYGLRPEHIVLFTYGGDSHAEAYKRISLACEKLGSPNDRLEFEVSEIDQLSSFLNGLDEREFVVCDITALSRVAMHLVLSLLARSGRDFKLIYTEAEEYYPREKDFAKLLREDLSEAFFNLVEYERAEIVYSATSIVEEIPGFHGHHLPNYPLMLVAFLAFKRSRLSAILREYESNATVLIKAIPIRPDLAWRARAMEIINFDLLESYKGSVVEVETLNWKLTYDFLSKLYARRNNKYRFNMLLAPLGSKMQTVGAWAFAFNNPDVRVVTSTPQRLFHDSYSIGWRDTFLIDDVRSILAPQKDRAP